MSIQFVFIFARFTLIKSSEYQVKWSDRGAYQCSSSNSVGGAEQSSLVEATLNVGMWNIKLAILNIMHLLFCGIVYSRQ